ncbi:MAG: HAD family hydrolase [Candidatus Bathyarchaeia archaeon]
MRVKAIIFDLFDTLLLIEGDFYTPSLMKLHNFLVKNGVSVEFEDFKRVYFEVRDRFYSESRQSFEEPHFKVRVSQTLGRLGYNFEPSSNIVIGATEAFAEEFMRYIRLDKEAPKVLEKLHEKYKLGLISNFAIPECGYKLLEQFGLRKFFDAVLISGEVNMRKPCPKIFEKALKALDVKASDAVFVGDMPDLDVAGPKKVGIKTVLLRRKALEECLNVKPDKIIASLGELLDLIEDC